MNILKAYNFISFSTIVFPLVFLGKYIFTNNNIYLIALAGLIFTNLFSEFLKYNIFKSNTRPALARDCNLMNNDGLQGAKPGMPSSHAAISTYFIFSFIYIDYKINRKVNFPLYGPLLVYLYLILLSRYRKYCHTVQQLFGGFLLGTIICCIQFFILKS